MKQWRFVCRKCTDKQYRFVLKAPNGEIIVPSEKYHSKRHMYNGINSIMKCGADLAAYQFKIDRQQKPYFNIRNTVNWKIIAGPSESYETVEARRDTIQAIMDNIASAVIIDNTTLFSLPAEWIWGSFDNDKEYEV